MRPSVVIEYTKYTSVKARKPTASSTIRLGVHTVVPSYPLSAIRYPLSAKRLKRIADGGWRIAVLTAQDQLNCLANGAASARRPRDIVSIGPHLGAGVGHGHGQAAGPHRRQVGQI